MIHKTNTINRRILFQEARNLGFIHEHRIRKTKFNPEVRVFTCYGPNGRNLHIQFWSDGNHRIWHEDVNHFQMSATDFYDLMGMYRAIAFEWQRQPLKN